MTESTPARTTPDNPTPAHGCMIDGQPAMPILISEHNALIIRVAEAEAKVLDYENRITWHTTCESCARVLDSSIRENERAGRAEAVLANARRLHRGTCLFAQGMARQPAFTCSLCAALDGPGPAATQATEPEEGQRDLLPPVAPEPSDPGQCSGEDGFCPEHGFHRHSLKQPGESSASLENPAADFKVEATPSRRAGLRDGIVNALGQQLPVAHCRAQADRVLALLYREWPWLRAEAEDADTPAWTPPPPGSTREQLPAALLALINLPDYVSTACQTAIHLEAGPAPTPTSGGAIPDVGRYVDRLHARCRKNQKFTGQLCICRCHATKEN